jgi:hypothetical protein
MAILVFLFFAALVLAGVLNRGTDSRDYADWRPSDDGWRLSPR